MGKCFNQLTLNDRLTIEKMLNTNKFSKQEIAETIGCTRMTIYREIKKGKVCGINTHLHESLFYAGDTAERITRINKRRQGAKLKAVNDKELLAFISKKIEIDRYSPRATVQYIKKHKLKFNNTISDFTIYRYVKKGYFPNLTMDKLPYEKTYHKKYQKLQKRASFGESIEKRPEYIKYRTEFGHWEMDSIEGSRDSKKSLLVLSERKTRKEIIELIPNKSAESVGKPLDRIEKELGVVKFRKVFKTITTDNGAEFRNWETIEKSYTGSKKKRTSQYFADAYCSWQRGTNENINKMIRRFLPKGTSFKGLKKEDVKRIEKWVNNYPRKILKFKTSEEYYQEEIEAA